jgi:hypothetical protein
MALSANNLKPEQVTKDLRRRYGMNNLIKYISALLIAVLVTGCGGSSDSFTSPGSSGTSTGTNTGGNGGSTASAVKLGSGTGSAFSSGILSVATSSLSAGGSTTVTATLVDSAGNPYTTPVDVTFVSTCLATGNATLTSPVTTVAGLAVSTYRAVGCTGTDVITATATVGSDTLSATGSVTVASAAVGSIEYVSASPSVIAIKGTGGAETSNVSFKVLDQSGGPVSGQEVTFDIDTHLGGLQITPTSGTTDANGLVQTVVQSGTTKTGVRVTATVTSTGISTQSDGLVVSTALADEDSFSLSASILSPEAYDYDGVVSTITARLADRYNNPVPDNTAVSFYTDGGSITGSCTTVGGSCSVNWTSQNPRPATTGRVHILAVAKGEESFVDKNGNGIFDSGDTFTDIPEAFEDDNEDDTYVAGERYIDQNGNLTHDGADGKFNGVLCQHPTLCGTTSINVYKNLVLVMSGSALAVNVADPSLSVTAGSKASASTTITIEDARGQRPPAGTTIEIAKSNGTILTPDSFTVPDSSSNGPIGYGLTIAGDGTTSSGLVTVKVTTPKGVVSYGYITFDD